MSDASAIAAVVAVALVSFAPPGGVGRMRVGAVERGNRNRAVGCDLGGHASKRSDQGGGPILVRGREFLLRVNAVIAQLAPALLAALVITETGVPGL